jgi:IPT/TIG domain/HYDIN/CFA65/VesB-like, Ig-like domain
MKTMRQKKNLFALLMLLAVFAACKGESPTAPTSTSGGGGGTVTPPTGSVVTLSVSTANPFTSSQSIITATVTQNGQPVPNGTAVEFTTDFGTFFETGTQSALRTTTNGVSTVTLTSSTAGKATIQAVVNNVSKTTSVTFQVQQEPGCPPNCVVTHPTITSVSPAFGSPGGGETVTITGTKFLGPVRVFFDFGPGTTPKEAFVASRTDTQIVVTSPPVDLGTGQTKNATIVVITEAGTATEDRASSSAPFVYQAEVLTPVVSAVSPDSGPIDGGTRITIFGSGFQAPVQVSFSPGATAGAAGWTAIQIVSVSFTQIVAITPTAREVNPNGSGALTGAVDMRVRNINSNTEVIKAVFFRYTAKMQITAAGPTEGPIAGGTKVVIDGVGFNDPVTVSIGGFVAIPIKVTGTQVTAVTPAIIPPTCSDQTGPIVVTNVDNGDQANGPTFIFRVPKPTILNVSPTSVTPGGSITVTVANAIPGTTKITVGDKAGFITAASTNPTTNVTSYTVTVPSNFTFPTQACTVGNVAGTQPVPLDLNVTYLSVESGCTDTVQGILRVNPLSGACTIPPPPNGVVSPAAPTCASTTPASPVATGSATGTATITVLNTAAAGSQPLTITGASASAQINGTFIVAPNTATIQPGGSQNFTVTVDPAAAGAFSANINFTSNNATPLTGCVSGTAAP